MSTICGKLCGLLLREHFGENVEKMGKHLFTSGLSSFKSICAAEEIDQKQARQTLCLMIQYGLISFSKTEGSPNFEYRFLWEKVLRITRYPRYLIMIKKMYSPESEAMVEELLRLGRATAFQIILRAYSKLITDKDTQEVDKALVQRLRDQLEVLVNKQYIERLSESLVPVDPVLRFSPPRIELTTLISAVESMTADSADQTLWTINHNRFHQDMRDDLLVGAASRRISPQAGDILRILLRQAYLATLPTAAVSNAVPLATLRDHVRKANMEVKFLEDYLVIMAEDSSKFVSRDDLSPNCAYVCNMQKALEELTWSVLASAVEVRHGVGAARIFRLTKEEEYIEQDEIQKRAMLPDKECKLLTYTLVQGGWLQQQELRKSLQKGGPTKSFFLFTVDLGQAVRMYTETCFRSLINCITRRDHVTTTHADLLDKQQRIDAITLHMRLRGADPEDIAEITELITPPESALLEKVHATINKLHQAELEIDSTLFILEMYIDSRNG